MENSSASQLLLLRLFLIIRDLWKGFWAPPTGVAGMGGDGTFCFGWPGLLSAAGRTRKATRERKISRDAMARSSPRGDPVGWHGGTWHPPSAGFPGGTASLKISWT